jgi:hypothetical protein
MESQKKIFNYTELGNSDQENARSLPYITKTPKTASTMKKNNSLIKTQTQSYWGNLTDRNAKSTKKPVVSTIDSLVTKVSQDLEMASTRQDTHIMSWDMDINLKKETAALRHIVVLKQKAYNEVYSEARRKEDLLERLKFELSCIQKDKMDENKATLSKRILEYNEIQKALLNENHYIEILKHMLRDRKNSSLNSEPPVLNIKKKLEDKNREIYELENMIERAFQEYHNVSKSIASVEKSVKDFKDFKSEAYNKNLYLLKQKKLMEIILKKEFDLNSKIHKQEEIENLIKKLEPVRKNLEDEEKKMAEDTHVLVDQEKYEKMFLKLREVTSTSKVKEIYENYQRLKEQSNMMEIIAIQSSAKIDSLTIERNKLNKKLNDIIFNHEDDRKINYREFEKIEINLKNRNKIMDENERILKNLGSIMGAICGSVTRLSSQLLGNSLIDVKPRNLFKYFQRCMARLEERLNYNQRLGKEQESPSNKFSTPFNYKSSPENL